MKNAKALSVVTACSLTMISLPQMDMKISAAGTMRDISTMEVVEEMGIGINLGNTFESCGDWIAQWGDGTPNSYETAWGSPTITQDMIEGIADAGFGVVRIPVAWSNLMATDGTYTISKDYEARVKEVVEWALDTDMYVIMNLHWDGGWLENLPTDYDNVMAKYSAIWTQLCAAFGDYGDKLIFESQNEELGWQTVWNQWGGTEGKDRAYSLCNAVNQKFVDIVRQSGANNEKRHLLISGYNTAIDLTCDALFKMPDDPANRCAVSVHYYTPSTFAILEEDADWGKCSSTWGTEAEISELNSNMDQIKQRFVDQGIPVIIGEYGCPLKNKELSSIHRYLTSVCEAALKRGGICPVLWDTPGGQYDRNSCQMSDKELHDALLSIRDTYRDREELTTTTTTITTTTSVSSDPVIVTCVGDADCSGELDISDAILLSRYCTEDPTAVISETGKKNADCNLDRKLTTADVTMMIRVIAKLIVF